jgi:outer membrane protein W
MMRSALTLLVLTLLFAAAPASAQSWEASGLVGFTPSAPIDQQADELDDLDIRSAFTWGVQGARFFAPSWGTEVLWTQQSTALQLGTGDSKTDLFTMTVRHLDGNLVYQPGRADARWRPFIFGGLGATFFSADTVESETKLSVDIGGGVKFFPWRSVGARAHFRYKPTFLNDSDEAFCDPFGFCQNVLQQVEFAAGVTMRF